MIVFLIVTHFIALAAGVALTAKYKSKAEEFTHSEVLQITAEVEHLRTKEYFAYNVLRKEWKAFVNGGQTKVEGLSSELREVISKATGR